jgi:hypothetical protein
MALTAQQAPWLEEDKCYLEMRVARLETEMAWAENPVAHPSLADGHKHPVALGAAKAQIDSALRQKPRGCVDDTA